MSGGGLSMARMGASSRAIARRRRDARSVVMRANAGVMTRERVGGGVGGGGSRASDGGRWMGASRTRTRARAGGARERRVSGGAVKDADVVVIGSGIGGLTAAAMLAYYGKKVRERDAEDARRTRGERGLGH